MYNCISGDDNASFNVGAFLTDCPKVAKVSFTGSVATGKRIMSHCADDVKRVTLELGGNDAAIVRSDVNVKEMAPKVFASAFGTTAARYAVRSSVVTYMRANTTSLRMSL